MNKSLLFLCLLGFWLSFFIPCLADNNSDEEFSEQIESYEENEQESIEISEGSGMVYASGKEYENACAALMNRDTFRLTSELEECELSIVKESITPLYYIDLEELSKNDELILYPLYNNQNRAERVYNVKVVDKNGLYAGRIGFYLKDGIAIPTSRTIFQNYLESAYIDASPSYADHAERIREILGAETVISPSDVRFVGMYAPYIPEYTYSTFWYIYNADYQVLISTGFAERNKGPISEKASIYMLDMKQLKEYADSYVEKKEASLRIKAQWEKEHPGEKYLAPAGSVSVDMEEFNVREFLGADINTNDINDIASYLNIDYSQNWDSTIELGADLKPIQNNSSSFLPVIFVSIGALLLILGVVVFLIVVHQRKRRNSIQP